MGQLTKLERLFLYNNQLSGIIPIELSKLTNLQEFCIYYNQLTGIIHQSLKRPLTIDIRNVLANNFNQKVINDILSIYLFKLDISNWPKFIHDNTDVIIYDEPIYTLYPESIGNPSSEFIKVPFWHRIFAHIICRGNSDLINDILNNTAIIDKINQRDCSYDYQGLNPYHVCYMLNKDFPNNSEIILTHLMNNKELYDSDYNKPDKYGTTPEMLLK